MEQFQRIDGEITRDTLIRLEKETFACDSPETKTDNELIVNVLIQLVNDLKEQKNHSHNIR